jgi:creatinine amidohydrolase
VPPRNPGQTKKRLSLADGVYTGIWWYARFPNHYSGEGAAGNKQLGEFDQATWSRQIAEAIKSIKDDQESLRLQNEFFEKSQHPLETQQ